MPWCFRTKGGAVSKSPMRCSLMTIRSGLAQALRATRDRRHHQFRCGRERKLSECEAGGRFEAAALPRSTRQIGAWIEKEFGLVYESRSGLIALLHRLGL